MFWPEPFDLAAAAAACNATWGVVPEPLKAQTEWGGRRIGAGSNIVFSNGLLDPWHGGGVLEDVSDTVVAVIIKEGAHHLDLMWSRDDDPQGVAAARRREMAHARRWVEDAARRRPAAVAAGRAAAAEAAGGVDGGGGAVAASRRLLMR